MISAPWAAIPFWKSAAASKCGQPLIDFAANHAGIFEPLHDHGHVLARVVIVIEALSGFVRVEDCDANHCCFLLYCTNQNAAWSGQFFSRVATMLALVYEIVGGREPIEAGTVSRSQTMMVCFIQNEV